MLFADNLDEIIILPSPSNKINPMSNNLSRLGVSNKPLNKSIASFIVAIPPWLYVRRDKYAQVITSCNASFLPIVYQLNSKYPLAYPCFNDSFFIFRCQFFIALNFPNLIFPRNSFFIK